MSPDRGSPPDVRTGEIALQKKSNGITVLSISGEHDLSTVGDLRSHIDELMNGTNSIVIDLSPATFVDSSILGVILDARRRAQDAGIGFAVVHGDGAAAVGRVLEITGLRAELPVHDSLDAALDRAAPGPEGKNP